MRSVRQNDYVFPGDKARDSLSDMALTETIRRMNEARAKAGLPLWVDPKQGNREIVPHGFRSSFRDWVDEVTAYVLTGSQKRRLHTPKATRSRRHTSVVTHWQSDASS
jgi:integrase